MEYLLSLAGRFLNAVLTLRFWTRGFLVFIFSGLGIWWPFWFKWPGYENIFYPEPWFTFGLATLMIIVGQRLFMSESEDDFIMPNRLILAVLAFFGGMCYGKSVQDYFVYAKKEEIDFDYSFTKYAILITLIAWLIHYIGSNEFNSKDPRNALGGGTE